MKTIRATINGTIHGVGYKYFVLKTALSNHIGGYIKNENDGTMTIIANGYSEQIDTFLSIIESGNGFTEIDFIAISEEPMTVFKEFRIIS